MEEKAPIAGQETAENETRKPTYEELMNAYVQVRQQNEQLINQIRQTNGVEKRLYFLFEVLKHAELFGDFAIECVNEVRDIMTLPKNEPETSAEEK